MKFTKNKINIKLPSNRKFGIFFTFVFTLASFYFHISSNTTWTYIFSIASLMFLGVTIVKAEILLPLNKLWMRLGLLLGMIISPIVLGIIFFVLITPFGFFTRVFGRDELRLQLKNNETYWKNRSQFLPQTDFKLQF